MPPAAMSRVALIASACRRNAPFHDVVDEHHRPEMKRDTWASGRIVGESCRLTKLARRSCGQYVRR